MAAAFLSGMRLITEAAPGSPSRLARCRSEPRSNYKLSPHTTSKQIRGRGTIKPRGQAPPPGMYEGAITGARRKVHKAPHSRRHWVGSNDAYVQIWTFGTRLRPRWPRPARMQIRQESFEI